MKKENETGKKEKLQEEQRRLEEIIDFLDAAW
jgi:hypothetical protein